MKEFIQGSLKYLKTSVTIPSGSTDSNIISLFQEQGVRDPNNPSNPINTFGLGKGKYILSNLDLPDDFDGTSVTPLIGITSDRVYTAKDGAVDIQLENGSVIDQVITEGSVVFGLRADTPQTTSTEITVVLTRND